jgi:DNA-binding transcriptional regulator YiaG
MKRKKRSLHGCNNILSKSSLAAKLGVSIGTLKNWERGWTHPNAAFGPLFGRY